VGRDEEAEGRGSGERCSPAARVEIIKPSIVTCRIVIEFLSVYFWVTRWRVQSCSASISSVLVWRYGTYESWYAVVPANFGNQRPRFHRTLN
jgi:hypothetical protein